MRILLIGGTGNISSEVADKLFADGHEIITVTSGKQPVPANYRSITTDRFDSTAFITSLSTVNADIVIDFMAFNPEQIMDDYTLFKGKIRQFIFISSATVYEKPHRTLPITESMQRSNPFWPYAQQKIACEEYLESVHADDFPVTIVRPSHTFGKKWIPSPINSHNFTVAQRILDHKPIIVHDRGESLWTLTAASDFAEALAGLVNNGSAVGEAFHITSDEPLSWNEIYTILGKELGTTPLIEFLPSDFIVREYPECYGNLYGDKREDGIFDNNKIKRCVPGFSCKKSFAQAIKESVDWYREDPDRRSINREDDILIDRLINAWRCR